MWDLPTRAFHWLLLVLVVAAFATGLKGGNLMVWHGPLGIAIAALLAFRVAWGLIGSTYARFAHFVRGPRAVLTYLRGEWREPGHNPLGALSVLALLAVLGFQVASGLVANDDIAFNGPLHSLVTRTTSDRLTGLHAFNMWLIVALVAVHVAAVAYYVFVRRENIVGPMLTGRVTATDLLHQPARGGGFTAFAASVAVAGAVAWMAAGGFLPSAPPPPPPESLPDW